MPTLPIESVLPDLRRVLNASGCGVLCAPPGSGKTTVTPLALLTESWLAGRSILLVEPRRLAARLAAVYMAGLLGEKVGQSVGYQVRFDRRISAATRVEVITEGILTRRLQQDPELAGTGLVIFDEFHERSLESDLALALCLEIRSALRDDLRLLVMSATMDPGPVSNLLGGAPVITCQGTMYPVELVSLPPPARTDSNRTDHVAMNVANGIRRALADQQGDILAFLPGAAEIRQVVSRFAQQADAHDTVLLPLYGDLSLADQARAILPDPAGRRRVILATTIAETSITIEGIGAVVDCGWKRVPRFDPNSGLTRLETVRISRASAAQRRGRAGRLGPGVCYQLWGPGVEHGLQDFDRPEILEADLAGLALQLATWGSGDPDQLHWLDPPPRGAFAQARTLLFQLGALDAHGVINAMGKDMSALPLHPRLAHMILKGMHAGCAGLACDLAALLSERDILRGQDRSADITDRIHALEDSRQRGNSALPGQGADIKDCRRVDQVSRQLRALLPKKAEKDIRTCQSGPLLALAFPDRIALQRPGAETRYRLANGRGAFFVRHEPLSSSAGLVIAALDAGRSEGRIFLAAPLDKSEVLELFADRLVHDEEIKWDEQVGAVTARRLTRLDALVLEEEVLPQPDPAALKAALLEGIRQVGLEVLPWSKDARALQERVNSLRIWQPGEKWPDLGDDHLLKTVAEWLAPYLDGMRTREQLRGLNMTEILQGRLDWQQQKRLDEYAPTHIEVPSGSRIRLRYAAGEPPVLAVRLQEMFGLADTPTVCRGRVPVLLHLLSPAQRPIQVTADLRGFWDGSYHAVKKEMKGRYPKHYWPDDPWQAIPTNRAKPRK